MQTSEESRRGSAQIGAGGSFGQRAANGAELDALARLDQSFGELRHRQLIGLHEVQGDPFCRSRADAGQAIQRGDQSGDGFGKRHVWYSVSSSSSSSILELIEDEDDDENDQEVKPGRLNPEVTLPISVLEISCACAQSLIGCGHDHVLDQLRVRRIERLRVDLDGSDRAVAFGDDLDCAAAAGRFDGAGGELGLDGFHLLLHSRSLLHEFSDAGHFESRVEGYRRASGSNFHNLAFEHFQCLLDERIVLEIVLVEWHGRELLL